MRCGIAPPLAGCNCRAAGDGTVNQSRKYLYMADLRAMDACRPLEASGVPDEVGVVSSPLVANEWETVLAGHPDREFAEFVVRGIREGFRIGFDYSCRLGEKFPRICGRLARTRTRSTGMFELKRRKGGSSASSVQLPYG